MRASDLPLRRDLVAGRGRPGRSFVLCARAACFQTSTSTTCNATDSSGVESARHSHRQHHRFSLSSAVVILRCVLSYVQGIMKG